MNKKLVTIIFLLITSILMNLYNSYVYYDYGLESFIYISIHLFIAFTITLFIKRKEHNKHSYNIFMGLCITFSVIYLIVILRSLFSCIFAEYCIREDHKVYLEMLNLVLVNTLLLLNILDIKKKINDRYFILNIIVCSIVSLIYLRFFIDPLFYHNVVHVETGMLTEYIYISQNFLYFAFMFICLITSYFINKNSN